MTRQEANKKILQILGDIPTKGALKVVDFNGTVEDYQYYHNTLNINVEELPRYRFVQLLWAMNLNLNNPCDRFYEESEETLNNLIVYMKSLTC